MTGKIKRAFILPQNKIIDVQTFAYFFSVNLKLVFSCIVSVITIDNQQDITILIFYF